MLRLIILTAACWMLACCCTLRAQRRITVIDADTYVPLKDVSVKADSVWLTTDYLGHVDLPLAADTVVFSHMEYMREKLAATEVTDTMYLFPKKYTLKEVVVLGVGSDLRNSIDKARERWLNRPKSTNPLTFDLGNMLDRRGRRDRKHLKKLREIFREFDSK